MLSVMEHGFSQGQEIVVPHPSCYLSSDKKAANRDVAAVDTIVGIEIL